MPTPSASDIGVDPALIARFRNDLTRLLDQPFAHGQRLALAVSGGPDSMGMLALAQAAFPGQVIVATVDHQLRARSGDEAALVADHCRSLDVPHTTLRPDAPIVGASLQARARDARYALLTGWVADEGASALATAHHADDQAETFLMRAARGSGVGGLAGIRARRMLGVGPDDYIPLVRPLLGWRRADLRAIAERAGGPFVDDESNRDPAYDRSRFRQLLTMCGDLDVVGIAASAAHAAEAAGTIAELAAQEWLNRRNWERPIPVEIEVTDLPRGLRRVLVRTAIGTVRGDNGITAPQWSDTANVEKLLDSLESGRGGSQAGVMARALGNRWRFMVAPPRRTRESAYDRLDS